MTITRITQVGCEPGHIDEFDGFYDYIEAGYSISASAAYTGNYGVRVFNESITRSHVKLDIPDTRQVRFGMFYEGTPDTPSCIVINLEPQVTIGAGTNGITLNVGGVAQGTIMMPPNMFHLGLDCKIDSSSGWVKLYTNGKERISMTGNTGNVDITEWQFGRITSGNFICEIYGDDIYIDDTTGESSATPPPAHVFYYITPDGNGNYAQWTGSDGNSTDNYLLVDAAPPNDSDYVLETVADQYDSYTMSTFTIPEGILTFNAIIPIVRAKRGDVTEQLAIGTRLSGVDLVSGDYDPTIPFDYIWERQTTKPGGGSWDQSSLDSVEVLIKSRGSF